MREYFSHDYSSRQDKKIKALLRSHGMSGYGIYWALVEDLYLNNNAVDFDCKAIAEELKVDAIIVESVIKDFKLFKIKGKNFYSESINARLEKRNEKSEKARKSAQARWTGDANALRTQSKRNAIKESIESKEKIESKERLLDAIKLFSIDELKAIYLSDANFQTRSALCVAKKILPNTLNAWLDEFCNYVKSTNEHEKTFNDFCTHFANWLGKKKDLNQKQTKTVDDQIREALAKQTNG